MIGISLKFGYDKVFKRLWRGEYKKEMAFYLTICVVVHQRIFFVAGVAGGWTVLSWNCFVYIGV